MNLETEILREHSKRQVVRIGRWIGNDETRFHQLMHIFLGNDRILTQRAAWIVSYCSDQSPAFIAPWISKLLGKMQESGVHDAVKRNGMRILQQIDIPHKLLGRVLTVCFDELASPDSPIAVRVYAMSVLANVAGREPDIARELRAILEQMQLEEGPALSARTRIVLAQLARQEKNDGKRNTRKQPIVSRNSNR